MLINTVPDDCCLMYINFNFNKVLICFNFSYYVLRKCPDVKHKKKTIENENN